MAQYIKLEITGVKSNSPDSYLQLSELKFYSGSTLIWCTAISCTYDGGAPSYGSPSENEQNLIDGSAYSKMCIAFVNGHNCTLICTLQTAADITAFQYTTANDSPNRDPISWKIYASDNGTDYTLISMETDASVTDSRNTDTQIFENHVPEPPPEWYISDDVNDGYPYVSGVAESPAGAMIQPFPLMLWRITEGVNEGYPYFLLQPEEPPAPVIPKRQKPYISVFAKNTEVSVLDTNGLAILTPTSCEITSTLNGMESLQMTHPIDPEGRWQYLIINNIIKANDEYYTIKTVDNGYTGASGEITVYAEHIFYQQNDAWIYPGYTLTGVSGKSVLNNINAHANYEWREGAFIYAFSWDSDIVPEKAFRHEIDAGCTPVDAMLGTYGFIDKMGGELYRHKFYYSINERMEGSSDNAFDIRVGKNLIGVTRTVDITTMASYFRGYDFLGGWVAYAWDFEAFFGDLFPHYVVRSENFSQPTNAQDEDFDYDDYFENKFDPEVLAFFNRNCKPLISYQIDLHDVRSNPDFEIVANEQIKVGDKGTLYDKRLGGTLTLEITETVYDCIRCEITQITVGDRQSFVRTATPNLAVDIQPIQVEYQGNIMDAAGNFILDADGKIIVQKGVISNA